MTKKKKNQTLVYVDAVKMADRQKEIKEHGKLISTRPERIKSSKKIYNRKRDNKKIRNFNNNENFGFFIFIDSYYLYL